MYLSDDLTDIVDDCVDIAWKLTFAGEGLQQVVSDLGMKMEDLEAWNRQLLAEAEELEEKAHKRTILCLVFAPLTLGLSCLGMMSAYRSNRKANHARAAIAFNEGAIRMVRQTIQPALLSYANTLMQTGLLFETHISALGWATDVDWGHGYFMMMNDVSGNLRQATSALVIKAKYDARESAKLI